MALCAYHEDDEAVAICTSCSSPICDKCLSFGQAGMCGMCLEMKAARPAKADPLPPAKPRGADNLSPPGSRPAPPPRPGSGSLPTAGKPPAASRSPAKTVVTKGAATKASGTVVANACAIHDGEPLTAQCVNCRKKVCPYCLDLYDLCEDCRDLARCSRHESLVAEAPCENCGLQYCKLCLANTPFCDRCRALGHTAPARPGPATPELPTPPKPSKPGTGKLGPKPDAAGEEGEKKERKPRPQRVAPGKPGYRPPPTPEKQARHGVRNGLLTLGILAIGLVGYVAFAKVTTPRQSPDETVAILKQEMVMVQQAIARTQQRTGQWPDTVEGIVKEIKAVGTDVDSLNPPLKIALNTPPDAPLTIEVTTSQTNFAIRALDAEGQVLQENGRDLVLRPRQAEPSPEAPEGASPKP